MSEMYSIGTTHKLKTLKMIMSTGSPLKPQSYDYVYREIKKDLLLASISGIDTELRLCIQGDQKGSAAGFNIRYKKHPDNT
jgi:acyl-coenzyme A synthetase/AMP-(fatty) acid ligase